MRIRLKRVYDKPARNDGNRVLVDRVWPRGVKKEEADLDLWMKEIAPSSDLRKWFGHDPDKWEEFKKKYSRELNDKEKLIEKLSEMTKEKTLTLVYSAKDIERNNAVALQEYLEERTG